jgi:hypothetical protein
VIVRHPAEFFIKAILIQNPGVTDAQVLKALDDRGFLEPPQNYLGLLRQEIPAPPTVFNPSNRSDRSSMRYLRDLQVYEWFHPDQSMLDAVEFLRDQTQRMMVEQTLLARLELKSTAQKLNRKYNWHLTEDSMALYKHFFWNVQLLTFDQWGRYLYERSALYDRYMAMLQATPQMAFFHMRLDQTLESKKMIQRSMEIAYFNLEEVSQIPGVRADKIRAIGILNKALTECHQALSTSDMALSSVLKEFERFRMDHPQVSPQDIKQLAPAGNYSGSGLVLIEGQKVAVP